MLDPEVTNNPGERFAWPEPFEDRGPFWTNFLDKDATMEILEFLHHLDDSAWETLRSQFVPQLISSDPGNSKLRLFINGVLRGTHRARG
jgi:surface carbohydrate biosynthesis protein